VNFLRLKTALLSLLWILPGEFFSQGYPDSLLAETREVARVLASREFAGRGYQENGHLIASEFIATKFSDCGMQKIPGQNSYFQKFTFALNRIDSGSVMIGKKLLLAGEDYIISSRSGGSESAGKILDCGFGMPDEFRDATGKFVMIREGFPEKIKSDEKKMQEFAAFRDEFTKVDLASKHRASAVIILRKKLTYGLSAMPVDIPVVEILESSWPQKKKARQSAKIFVASEFVRQESQNVLGWIEGKGEADSIVVVCAHYDHLGKQGTAIFTGGNDNASGTAMMLSMAKHFNLPENRPQYDMAFIAFGAEEAGLIGSQHFVTKEPLFPLEKIRFVLNLDLMANGDEGIAAVAGLDAENLPTKEFTLLQSINDSLQATPLVKGRKNAHNSDHYYFVEKGIPAMFIYTLGGPPHYHDVHDTYEEMRFSKYVEIRELLIFLISRLGSKP